MKIIINFFSIIAAMAVITLATISCGNNGDPSSQKDDYLKAGLYNKAQPISPSDTPIDLSSTGGDNIVAKAFSYVRANSGNYTLLLDEDIETGTTGLIGTGVNASLTLIGIDVERTITYNGNVSGALFMVREGNNIILGQNITLKGIDNGEYPLVEIRNSGRFTMLTGSKITGHTNTGNTIYSMGIVNSNAGQGSGGFFIMEGGNISGNSTEYCIALWAGSFTMNSGTITGNSGGRAVHTSVSNLIIKGGSITENSFELDDIYIDYRSDFSLSGNTAFNKIRLTSYSTTGLKPINITGPYSGTVTSLDLIKGNNGTFEDGVVVMQAIEGYTLTETDANNFTLGNFMTSFNGILALETHPINDTHKLELDTANNAIRLVAK